jgi:S-formylglutathione hydrolase
MDIAGRPAWETFVGVEFAEHLEQRYELNGTRAAFGLSMGGYGALKLAFRRPDSYAAVAALCPVIFPAETSAAVPEKNRPSILGDLNRAMGEDEGTYRGNTVYGLARANRDLLRGGGTRIYFDCSSADEFNLHDGAVYLDQLLKELRIPHEFRSIEGAGHADAKTASRQANAIRFLGRALRSF